MTCMYQRMTKDSSKKVALGSTAINVILFIVKATIAIHIASLSLLTDSIHTLTDSISSIGVYLGLRLSDKPPDEMHPYGHGRAEHVAVLLVGLLLVIGAVKFLSDGVLALVYDAPVIEVGTSFMLVIIGTAIVKLGMWAVSYYIGKNESTASLQADAWHHLTDVCTTVLVILALWGASNGHLYADSLVSIGISLFIMYVGIIYARNAINDLLGAAPSQELLKDIKRKAESLEGVKEVHGIKVHDYGRRAAISLHMRPEESTSGLEGHRTAHALKRLLEDTFSAAVEVHQDPWEPPEEQINHIIQNLADNMHDVKDIHKVKILEKKDGFFISLHIMLPRGIKLEKAHVIGTSVEKKINRTLKERLNLDMDVQVHIEPSDENYDYYEVQEHHMS
ncbi:MAG: cation diffusion facilitator family transporter [Thermoplasmata archaeon]